MSTPPCTIPKRICPGAAGAATDRSAQRAVRSTARSTTGRSAPPGGHSSKAIAMSEPNAAWMPMALSGVMRSGVPS